MTRMKLVFAAPILALLIGLLSGCSDSGSHHHKARKLHVKHENVTLHQLKPGNSHGASYAYQDDAGFWWYYIILSQQTSTSSSSSYSYPASSGGGRVSLPPGGSWSKADKTEGPQEEEIEPGQEQEITVSETEEAGPLNEAQEAQVEQSGDESISDPSDTGGTDGDTGGTDGGDSGTDGGDSGGDSGGGDSGGGDSGGGGE